MANPTDERGRCAHGWKGSVPENGARIQDECPSCGLKSVFIGSGGYLTCGNLSCKQPSIGGALAQARAELEAVRKERDKLQSDWAHYVEPLKADLERSRAETAAWRNGEKGEVALFIEKERRMHARLSRLEGELEAVRKERDLAYARGCRDESAQGAKNMAPVVERLSRLEAVVREESAILRDKGRFMLGTGGEAVYANVVNGVLKRLAAALVENGEVG